MQAFAPCALIVCGLASPLALAYRDAPVEYARVLSSEPIYETRAYSAPREQCWSEQVPEYASTGPRSYTAPIVGALVGGAIGNALGHHNTSRKVGAVAGAALGASVGNDIGNRNSYRQVGYNDQRVCRTVADTAYREEVVAYRVRYRYNGRDYVTEMPEDPGRRLPLRVNVEPLSRR